MDVWMLMMASACARLLENDGWASRGSETMATSRYHRRLMLMSSCIEHQRPRWKRYQNRAKAEEKLCKLRREPKLRDLPAAWWWIQKQGTFSVCVFFFDCSARAVPAQTSTSSKTTSKWFTLNCTLCVCSIIMQNERNKRTTKKKLFRSEETERRKKKQFYSIGVRIMRHFGMLSGPLIAQLTAESYITHT